MKRCLRLIYFHSKYSSHLFINPKASRFHLALVQYFYSARRHTYPVNVKWWKFQTLLGQNIGRVYILIKIVSILAVNHYKIYLNKKYFAFYIYLLCPEGVLYPSLRVCALPKGKLYPTPPLPLPFVIPWGYTLSLNRVYSVEFHTAFRHLLRLNICISLLYLKSSTCCSYILVTPLAMLRLQNCPSTR